MSNFDPKICQEGHTDEMECLRAERDRVIRSLATERDAFGKKECELKFELATLTECLHVQVEIEKQVREENERLKQQLITISALHGTGHYIEGEPGHEYHGCLASDIAEQALAGEAK